VGWLHRLTVLDDDENVAGAGDEVAARLLEALEAELAGRGARRLATTVAPGGSAHGHLERHGYGRATELLYLERDLPEAPRESQALRELGGRAISPGLWDELKGLEDAKEIIERRVILPLAEPDLASRHAVAPPRAIVLFGPPGTGKTTFAKGIASRLGWPFVELEPAHIGEGGAAVALLSQSFERILDLPAAVVFIDEVEDVAARREEQRMVSSSVTNELLRQIPRMRAAAEHLLVCATNWVGRLDPAFLRPGRFDYVLPVGPPDDEARRAIWGRYVDEITDEQVDIDALVRASKLFTPADIEFAARKAAQRAFEHEHFHRVAHRATTDDFLVAIDQTKPTLSREIVESFEDDTRRFGRY
jgi:SpoVK/Ycf46/Vps4 family AAA+-type ATPase